jgi:hypothetical protein
MKSGPNALAPEGDLIKIKHISPPLGGLGGAWYETAHKKIVESKIDNDRNGCG